MMMIQRALAELRFGFVTGDSLTCKEALTFFNIGSELSIQVNESLGWTADGEISSIWIEENVGGN